jgi:hypothetical protein
MFYIKNRMTNDSYSRSKYLRALFAENKPSIMCELNNKQMLFKRREIQTLHCSKRFTFFNAYSVQLFIWTHDIMKSIVT